MEHCSLQRCQVLAVTGQAETNGPRRFIPAPTAPASTSIGMVFAAAQAVPEPFAVLFFPPPWWRPNTEVLDAETLKALTYSNYYSAVYDAALAVFQLQRAVGALAHRE